MKPGQKLFCVVKANAYGHGAARLAPVMEEAGADGFCVAMLDEGLELRRAQIVKPILVLGLQPAEEAALAARQGYEGTLGMLAKHGRMAIRGEASRAYLDPGAAVAALLVRAWADQAAGG